MTRVILGLGAKHDSSAIASKNIDNCLPSLGTAVVKALVLKFKRSQWVDSAAALEVLSFLGR